MDEKKPLLSNNEADKPIPEPNIVEGNTIKDVSLKIVISETKEMFAQSFKIALYSRALSSLDFSLQRSKTI